MDGIDLYSNNSLAKYSNKYSEFKNLWDTYAFQL